MCVSLLAIVLLCGLACREMDARLRAEEEAVKQKGGNRVLKARLAKKSLEAFWAKENAAGAAKTDGESK